MDDSHRDDCFILAENKGFMLVEELERARSFHSSNNIKLIIHQQSFRDFRDFCVTYNL